MIGQAIGTVFQPATERLEIIVKVLVEIAVSQYTYQRESISQEF